MRALLDTHALLWMLAGDPRLGRVAAQVVTALDSELWFSVASYWEIGIKVSLGKLQLEAGWQATLQREMAQNRIQWLHVTPDHVHGVVDLPFLHRDPFDRLLVAQARHEALTLLSVDPQVRQYDVASAW